MSVWTPYQIGIILHFHCRPGPFERQDAPIYRETLAGLIEDRLLEPRAASGCYQTTERGQALIAMWCATPLPEARFVDPRFAAETP